MRRPAYHHLMLAHADDTRRSSLTPPSRIQPRRYPQRHSALLIPSTVQTSILTHQQHSHWPLSPAGDKATWHYYLSRSARARRSRTVPRLGRTRPWAFASPCGLTPSGSDYVRSPMTPHTRPSCQTSCPSCQANRSSYQASHPNHIHLLGHHDLLALLLHSASIKLSHALIFF